MYAFATKPAKRLGVAHPGGFGYDIAAMRGSEPAELGVRRRGSEIAVEVRHV